jgi:hypothetical protein
MPMDQMSRARPWNWLTIFTGLTLLVVTYYTKETVRLRQAAERQNERDVLPIVVLDSDGARFLLRNIGRGPALDVDDVKLLLGSDTLYLHHSALIAADQFVTAEDLSPTAILGMIRELKVRSGQETRREACVRYQDSGGIWHDTRQYLDVGETNQLIIRYRGIHNFLDKNAACQTAGATTVPPLPTSSNANSSSLPLVSFLLSALVGALTSLLVSWYFDQATSPQLEIRADDTPRQTGQHPGSPRHQFLQIKVNQTKGSWPFRSRRAALNCRGVIDVFRQDGTRAIAERITARWSGSLQPYRTQVVDQQITQIPDTSLLPLGQRFDVHSYSDEQVGIAVKFEGADDCWIFSNESYLFPRWQNPSWRLPRGEYLLRFGCYYEAKHPSTQWFSLRNEGPGFDTWSIELLNRDPSVNWAELKG